MTEKEMGWVVGFLEGEGSFCAHKVKKGRYVGLQLTAAQVQREPLDRLKTLLGGHISAYQGGGRRNRNPIFRWSINGPSARLLMGILLPDMSPRRQAQIAAAIARWEARPKRQPGRRASDRCQLKLVV